MDVLIGPEQSAQGEENGFTLVETLVAIALLAVALVAMMPLFLSGMKLNSSAFDRTTANEIAKQELEKISLLPSGDPTYLRLPSGATCVSNDPRCASGGTGCPCIGSATAYGTAPTALPVTFYFQDAKTAKPISNPYLVYYTVQEFSLSNLGSPMTASDTNDYDVKRADVFVTSTKAGLIGLKGVTESTYIRNTRSYAGTPGW